MRKTHAICGALALAGIMLAQPSSADSVAQVSTAKRISRQTVALIDPQGRPVVGGTGSDTVIKVGDVLTFIIQFTPVPNGAYRGLGGYITDYIPQNTEVVGARIVDAAGNTVPPHRGGLASDGLGPRGSGGYMTPLIDGSMSQLYADTGIFFSTDPRTARAPTGSVAGEAFITLNNGLPMTVSPTGADQLGKILGVTAPYYAHNTWDLTQVFAFGGGGGGAIGRGTGNTPEHIGNAGFGYGSFVAGPDTWYQLEATHDATLGPLGPSTVKASAKVGPWKRIRTTGGEIGRRGVGATPPSSTQIMPSPGIPTRVGIPALIGGDLLGYDLSTSNPLPAGTNAVRFALGELVVGDEYYAEISLRVKGLPLDPVSKMDINCAEVTGGDASSRDQSGGSGGKDHTWRYFLPAPSCVLLNLLFENKVDKVLANAGSTLTYTIEGKNLSTAMQTGVQVRDCFRPGDVTLIPAGTTPGYTLDATGAGCPEPAFEDALVWTVGTLAPGASFKYTVSAIGKTTTTNRAVYTSAALPAPGFSANAFTTIADVPVMRLGLTASPDAVMTPPGTVKYQAVIKNVGTGTAALNGCTGANCYAEIILPAPFAYVVGTTKINGAAITANPTVTGQNVRFGSTMLVAAGASAIVPGATLTIDFDARVPIGTPVGIHRASLATWVKGPQDLEDSIWYTAPVAVGQPRSDAPVIEAPILQGSKTVAGKTTEAAGSKVVVFVNGNPQGSGTSTATGTFSITVPQLFAGQHVTATLTAPSELESFPSAKVIVSGVVGSGACADGIDNDGDGKKDFPEDPGCSSAIDADETDVPQCSDGVDNDGDGKIDFPEDPGCSSYLDAVESALPACSDGVDDDGDGKTDFPADPGCTSAMDTSEADLAGCSNGIDDDGDGKIDFPFDPGCSSPLDEDEKDIAVADGGVDAGASDGSSDTTAASDTTTGESDAAPPDPGGLPDPGSGGDTGGSGGCGCRTTARSNEQAWGLSLLAFAVVLTRRRRHR